MSFESAYIDGATPFTAFTRLILPLSLPALASFAIFQFLWVWNDVVIVGTIDADETQGALVTALLERRRPMITVALRTPYDLARYPSAPTFLCTYGIHPPSLDALSAGLFGLAPLVGTLPVSIPDMYPVGHGIHREASR